MSTRTARMPATSPHSGALNRRSTGSRGRPRRSISWTLMMIPDGQWLSGTDGAAVPELALQPGFRGVSAGAEDADRVQAVLHEALGDVQLGHRRRGGGIPALGLQPGIPVNHQAARLQPEGHVDDPVGDGLELTDR